jgi:undecaprenyl-diphosphatase
MKRVEKNRGLAPVHKKNMNSLSTLQLIITTVATLSFIILAAWVVMSTSIEFDREILAWFSAHTSSMATATFRLITWAGSIFILAPLVMLIGYILMQYQHWQEAVFLASSFVAAAIIARLLKYLIGRERPDVYPALVDTYTQLAFPSVHVAQVSAFCLALYLVLRRCRLAWHAVVGVVLFVLALAVLCSRLYLQVHYPSDVIAGALLGIICALGCSVIFLNTSKVNVK